MLVEIIKIKGKKTNSIEEMNIELALTLACKKAVKLLGDNIMKIEFIEGRLKGKTVDIPEATALTYIREKQAIVKVVETAKSILQKQDEEAKKVYADLKQKTKKTKKAKK